MVMTEKLNGWRVSRSPDDIPLFNDEMVRLFAGRRTSGSV